MKNLVLSVFAVSALFVFPLSTNAQEKGKKGNSPNAMVSQLLKQLEKAELTADQTTKVKELYTKAATDVTAKRTAARITPEMLKKRTDASKAAKEAGKKGKEIQEAANAAMGMTPEQVKIYADTEEVLAKARIEIGKMLSPEQIAKLPEQAQNSLKEKTAGKKGKKK